MDLIPEACSQSTGQLPVSFNSVGAAVVTVAAISYMATTGLGVSWRVWGVIARHVNGDVPSLRIGFF